MKGMAKKNKKQEGCFSIPKLKAAEAN